MKFNILLSNPPYTLGKSKQPSYSKFIVFIIEHLTEHGYLCAVHPSSYRRRRTAEFNTMQKLFFYYDVLYHKTITL